MPQFVGGGDTPDFGHAFRACYQFSLSSVQRARRLDREKKKKKERKKKESLVKYKSADMYVGRLNKTQRIGNIKLNLNVKYLVTLSRQILFKRNFRQNLFAFTTGTHAECSHLKYPNGSLAPH